MLRAGSWKGFRKRSGRFLEDVPEFLLSSPSLILPLEWRWQQVGAEAQKVSGIFPGSYMFMYTVRQ